MLGKLGLLKIIFNNPRVPTHKIMMYTLAYRQTKVIAQMKKILLNLQGLVHFVNITSYKIHAAHDTAYYQNSSTTK